MIEAIEQSVEKSAAYRQLMDSEIATLKHLESSGFQLSPETWTKFLRKVEVRQLNKEHNAQEFGVENLIALTNRNGELKLDEQFYSRCSETQQRRILLHEFSHQLDYSFQHRGKPENEEQKRLNDSYQSVRERLGKMEDIEVSHYADYYGQRTNKDKPEEMERHRLEQFAEASSQYLEGGGTFEGYMRAKLVQFPDLELTPDELESYQNSFAETGLEGNFDDYFEFINDEEYREEFLNYHPKLRAQYELWQDLDGMFQNSALLENNQAEAVDLDEEWMADDMEMVSHIPPPPSRVVRQPASTESRGQPAEDGLTLNNFIQFWKIFA